MVSGEEQESLSGEAKKTEMREACRVHLRFRAEPDKLSCSSALTMYSLYLALLI